MPVIKVRENESFDVALRRFKRSCEKAGILAEVRAREFYENQLQSVNVKKQHLLNVTLNVTLAKSAQYPFILICSIF